MKPTNTQGTGTTAGKTQQWNPQQNQTRPGQTTGTTQQGGLRPGQQPGKGQTIKKDQDTRGGTGTTGGTGSGKPF